MKRNIIRILLAVTLITGFSQASHAQRIYVTVQPAPPVEARPAPPSATHVWIDGEWVWQNRAYVWRPGYWTLPPQGQYWVRGHWRRVRGGWFWVTGHWVRY